MGKFYVSIISLSLFLNSIRAQPDVGLELSNREIGTWAEIQNRMLNWLNHSGAPQILFYYITTKLGKHGYRCLHTYEIPYAYIIMKKQNTIHSPLWDMATSFWVHRLYLFQ